jgi:hypothetical protein
MHPEYDGYTNEVVKQADVVCLIIKPCIDVLIHVKILLGFPLMYEMPASVRANDLKFYANYTDLGGPAMTWAMFALGWIDLGEYEQAAKYFLQGCVPVSICMCMCMYLLVRAALILDRARQATISCTDKVISCFS